ncbi:hypothetical protein DLJ61_25410 [Gordonia terrae]|uniref:Uncharacterized protein n=1 Tax=Gordonia terrae TaxID=2055 RepID=A0AAD0KDK3_9ACTN|nr:hypothetical protein DLJ61_25410 [Gordonia terrae]
MGVADAQVDDALEAEFAPAVQESVPQGSGARRYPQAPERGVPPREFLGQFEKEQRVFLLVEPCHVHEIIGPVLVGRRSGA